jgi:hypothetical protein
MLRSKNPEKRGGLRNRWSKKRGEETIHWPDCGRSGWKRAEVVQWNSNSDEDSQSGNVNG